MFPGMTRAASYVASVTLAVCGLFFGAERAAAQTAFYQASEAEIAGPVGTIIRQESMFGAAAGAAAYRVLYRSTRPDGTPIAVSGVIVVPAGAPSRWLADCRLGASDHRNRAALCAFARNVRVSADGG